MLLAMMSLQFAGSQVPLPFLPAVGFDLAHVARDRTACFTADPVYAGNDIVVCGHKKAMDAQLPKLDFVDRPIRAETRLFNAVPTSLDVVQRTVAGVSAPAIVLSLKIPF